jgi:3D (Asp-Asp-Asp) domain-containing protein
MRLSTFAGILIVILLMAITADYLDKIEADIQSLQADVADLQQDQNVVEFESTDDVRKVTVSAYTASADECNEDPENTAIMRKPVPGWTAAVSRDLLEDGWVFGTKVWIDGTGLFEVADVMNQRYSNRIDVLVGTKEQARMFGVREGVTAVRVKVAD